MQYRSQSLPTTLASPAYSAPVQRVYSVPEVHTITTFERIFTTLALLFVTEPLIMLFRQQDPRYGAFLFVVFLLLYNLTEAPLVRRNNVAVAHRLSLTSSATLAGEQR